MTWVITGRDRGLDPEEPDGKAVPLPSSRPLIERDVQTVRFDTALRGYRMDQVDAAIRRAAYDIGYKEELIGVLEAELAALRAGDIEEADALRAARDGSAISSRAADGDGGGAGDDHAIGEAADESDRQPADQAVEIDHDVADDEPAVRPGATDSVASETPASAVSGR